MIIVELSSNCRRQPTVGGADSSVDPVTHIISPDHSLQLFHSVVLQLVLTAVEQLFLHSCPHTFTACIIMTSSACTVHALNDSIFLYSSIPASFLCCNARYIRSLPQQSLYWSSSCFVDLHHFICKHLILPGGVFMTEMIAKCLSCNLQSLAVKTDPSCDPTAISLLENEL